MRARPQAAGLQMVATVFGGVFRGTMKTKFKLETPSEQKQKNR